MSRIRTGTRRRARLLVMLAFYQADVLGEEAGERLRAVAAAESRGEARQFAERLIELYERHRAAVDRALREAGARWELERMAATDRAILRAAATEILLVPEVPAAVSINEAIEIAKDYGGDEAGRFVNGILDAVRREMVAAREEAAAATAPATGATAPPDGEEPAAGGEAGEDAPEA